MDNLETEWNQGDNLSRAAKLDNIHAQVIGLLLYAKKIYRKLRIGEVDFSPEVSKAVGIWYL